MTKIFVPSVGERTKWRRDAHIIAQKTKLLAQTHKEPSIKIGVAFDDGFISVELSTQAIKAATLDKLSSTLFWQVAQAVDEKRLSAKAKPKEDGPVPPAANE